MAKQILHALLHLTSCKKWILQDVVKFYLYLQHKSEKPLKYFVYSLHFHWPVYAYLKQQRLDVSCKDCEMQWI